MLIDRPIYLQKLIESRHNHMIKIVAGESLVVEVVREVAHLPVEKGRLAATLF